jgi:hypothetical protein
MEFQEFAKQYLRMHNAYFKKDCKGCPLKSVCSEFSNCTYVSIKYPREAESIVAKWAAEHPKPVYPTWAEWQAKVFPDSENAIGPCDFLPTKDIRCDDYKPCTQCRQRPIPAHIAEKLGIKPVHAEPPKEPEKPQEPKYREVKRRAKVGEKIKLVHVSFDFNEVGDVLTVCAIHHGLVAVRSQDHPQRDNIKPYPASKAWHYYDYEYVVLEPITEA